MTKLEKDIEAGLRRMVEKHGGMCLKFICPGWAGVPDRVLLLPGGKVIFAETKRPKGGRLSGLQRWWMSRLTNLGFYAVVVWTVADIRTLELIIMDGVR